MASDIDKLTNDAIAKGGVLAMLYFDLHGTSKEMLQEIGAGFIQKILQEPGVVFALGEIAEPLESDDLFSTSVQVKVLTKELFHLITLCASYSPFSVEILRPDKLELNVPRAQEMLMHVATLSFDYKKYILEKVSTPEELERYKKSLSHKMELGRRVLEQKGGNP